MSHLLARKHMLDCVDAKAGAVRSRYITVAPGQEATYLMKAAQARRFQDAGYIGPIPGLVQAEMVATETDAETAVKAILAEEEQWANLAAQIETIRRRAKIQILKVETDDEAEAISQDAIKLLSEMMP